MAHLILEADQRNPTRCRERGLCASVLASRPGCDGTRTTAARRRCGSRRGRPSSSGLDDQGEYVFRQLAQITMGRFTFLTYGADGASPGDSTRNYTSDYAPVTIVVYALFSLRAVVVIGDVVSTLDGGAIVFELVWVLGIVLSGLWLLLAEPLRVEVLSEGLRFVAPARTVLIPWEALKFLLASVRLERGLAPLRFGRRRIHTWRPYDQEFQELLTVVREHAPSADLRAAVTRRPTWGGRRSKPSPL